jgi:hypothetical protein
VHCGIGNLSSLPDLNAAAKELTWLLMGPHTIAGAKRNLVGATLSHGARFALKPISIYAGKLTLKARVVPKSRFNNFCVPVELLSLVARVPIEKSASSYASLGFGLSEHVLIECALATLVCWAR